LKYREKKKKKAKVLALRVAAARRRRVFYTCGKSWSERKSDDNDGEQLTTDRWMISMRSVVEMISEKLGENCGNIN